MSRFEALLVAARRRVRPIIIWMACPSTKRSIANAYTTPGKDPGHDFQA